jgi:DDE domain
VNHFGPMIAAHLRKRRPKPHATWHLDEVYLKIDGRMVYLWRAVDAEGGRGPNGSLEAVGFRFKRTATRSSPL